VPECPVAGDATAFAQPVEEESSFIVFVNVRHNVSSSGWCVRLCDQVSSPLIRRVTQVDTQFIKEIEFEPRVASEFDFQLDSDAVLQAIHAMDFFELKGT